MEQDEDITEQILVNANISPVACNLEDGTFENMPNGFLISNSCLFSQSGGDFIVTSGQGKDGTVGLTNLVSGSSTLHYSVNIKKSAKLAFDYRTQITHDYFKFYINDIEYHHTGPGNTGVYSTYETPLLPPGTYTFKWVIRKGGASGSIWYLWLDNLRQTP